jgi:hypothetical protein
VRSLKAANIDVTDIWFVITKHLEILQDPIALQRWLDFLSLQVRTASCTGMHMVDYTHCVLVLASHRKGNKAYLNQLGMLMCTFECATGCVRASSAPAVAPQLPSCVFCSCLQHSNKFDVALMCVVWRAAGAGLQAHGQLPAQGARRTLHQLHTGTGAAGMRSAAAHVLCLHASCGLWLPICTCSRFWAVDCT